MFMNLALILTTIWSRRALTLASIMCRVKHNMIDLNRPAQAQIRNERYHYYNINP